jgi:gamma-glutamylcyclotransferase (GGCT)/AIG2-like uncharacterized protein YtfP
MSRVLVFAYGSNMHSERMLERIPGALARGRARLAGRRLVINKHGRDGSAKANLAHDATGFVWGVVWELSLEEVRALDRHEAGYERVIVPIETEDGPAEAEAYVSERLSPEALPYDWYVEHLVRGARAFGFPDDYVAWLEAHPRRRQRSER